MVHGSLQEFDPTTESIKDSENALNFIAPPTFMTRVNMPSVRKLALFMALKQETFAKLNGLTSRMPVADPNLNAHPWTLAIGHKQLKLQNTLNFQMLQGKGRSVAEFMAELWWLVNTCTFGDHLNTCYQKLIHVWSKRYEVSNKN